MGRETTQSCHGVYAVERGRNISLAVPRADIFGQLKELLCATHLTKLLSTTTNPLYNIFIAFASFAVRLV